MINNRQGGRRRGRGGQRGQNLGSQSGGNRQDNRQRGNAAQLLEKYKSMARDAQLGGDRVQTEYYLQFADHYFRVLGESQARFNDQRPQRDRDFDDDGDEEMLDASDEQQGEDNRDDDDRGDRNDRQGGDRNERADRGDRSDRGERADGGQRRRRYSRDDAQDDRGNRANGAERPSANVERIAVDVLPPAIGRDEEPAPVQAIEQDEDAPRPRRRTRRPPAEDNDTDIAPAA